MAWKVALQLRQDIAVLAFSAASMVGLSSKPADAADICRAVALVDIPKGITGYALKKGEIDEAITQYNVDKNGDGQFCSHGGGCYPRYVVEGNGKVEALRLTNCKIGAPEPPIAGIPDDGTTTYEIDVDRSKNSTADLKYDDVDNALLNIGMCSACAGNAAYLYIHKPASQCGLTVANALTGDRLAINTLQADPDYCQVSDDTPTVQASPIAAIPPPVSTPATAMVMPPAAATGEPDPKVLIKIGIAVAAILYFVPTLIAFIRRKRNAKALFALNLFLGWSFLGWVAALIWSLLNDGIDGSTRRHTALPE